MKRIIIVFLAAMVMVVSACAGGIPKAGDFGDGLKAGDMTISSQLSTEARNAVTTFQNWLIVSGGESGTSQSRNWNSRLTMPGRPGSENIPQNIQPVVNREKNRQLHPFYQGESLKNREMLDREDLNRFLENQYQDHNYQQENKSYYQAYVAPDDEAVSSYLKENGLDDKYEIYEAALSWTWVSDKTLFGEEEKWLTPAEFLEDTPDYSSNPTPGGPASDCEEQANTLASLLIASEEYDASAVRVAVGEVNFGDVSGGHAWVEVYEDGVWFPLDPTGGPYYDDESSELVPVDVSEIDYEEYLKSEYTAVEVWYYYNNEYFLDFGNQNGNAPVFWNKKPGSYPETGIYRQLQNIRPL